MSSYSCQRTLHWCLVTGVVPTFCLAWLAMPVLSYAEPLPQETCDTLKGEQDTLVTAGVKDDMAKGPVWAKGNLRPARLKDIERFIDLEEQLNFRCGLAKAKLTQPEEAAPKAAAEPSELPKAEVKPKPKPKAKTAATEPATDAAALPAEPAPPAKPKSRPKPKAASVADPAVDSASPPAEPAQVAKPKPKPKPKVDDAYRPPASGTPGTDPFARQIAPKG